jgi:GNAT superfamily N-acetyltransferase
MRPTYRVELARATDIEHLAAIERAAVSLFAPGQIPDGLRAEVTPIEELRAAHDAGLLWVARASTGPVVGFAIVDLLAGGPHLEEIDVHPDHGRRGVGRALVEAVLDWAWAAGHRIVTLTTFRDVAWNAPFYERLGFRVLDRSELTAELVAIVGNERARGLDPGRRVVMRCDLRIRQPGGDARGDSPARKEKDLK